LGVSVVFSVVGYRKNCALFNTHVAGAKAATTNIYVCLFTPSAEYFACTGKLKEMKVSSQNLT
jgi:hypothetical protein